MNQRFWWGLTVFILCGSAGSFAYSQTADAQADEGELEAVIVSAQRRSENLQAVPITVSSISEASLQQDSITDTSALVAVTPGLIFQQSGNFGTPFLRGIGATTAGPEVEPSVAFYLDGVYLQSESSILLNFNNIDHVEVLEGPQGTLFGRNASAGVIQVITKTPSDTPSAEFLVGYGNYNTVRGSFYGTRGLGDNVAVDLAVQGQDQPQGWGRSLATGAQAFTSANGGARSKVLWTPDAVTTVTLAADVSFSRDDSLDYVLFPGAKNVLGVAPYDGFYNPDNVPNGNTHSRDEGVSLHVDRDLGWGKLLSISADRFQQNWDVLDSTQTPLPLTLVDIFTQVQTFSQELQLQSPASTHFNWIVGAYYLHDIAKLDPDHLFGLAIPAGGLNLSGTEITNSYAAFGQTTVTIATDTHLTLGLRYTQDHKSIAGNTAVDGFPIPGTIASQEKTFNKPTWRIALDRQFTPDVLGYFSYNRGFKSGSFSVDSPAAPPVKPEVVDAYELGWKTEWWEHRVRVNGSVFYYNVTNMQVQEFDSETATEYFTNAASSKIYGLDLDFKTRLTSALSLMGGLERLHARYEHFPDDPAYIPNPAGGGTLIDINASHLQINSAPNFSANTGFAYLYRTTNGTLDLNVLATYIDDYPVNPDGRVREPVEVLLSSALKWTLPGDHWDLRFWGANLLNRHYYLYASAGATGDQYSPAAPRTFGFTVGGHW
jgi:iron complex outermembrane recepter protein